jgi:hypothetical protein
MTKLRLILVAVVALLGASLASYAQDGQRSPATATQNAGMRHGERPPTIVGDRDHRRRPIVVIVAVPSLAGPDYYYYSSAPEDLYRTLDGFYYYCPDPAGYYPVVPDCPNGWRLIP